VQSFDEVEGIFDDGEIRQEVLSCLGCGYEAVDPEECIACGMCQKLCPKGDVITMVAKEGGNEK
jgi:NAD-dependent dihydropyrimidine dehydrogenase PreA subunit